MTERYRVVNRSTSGHCCFGFSVVDMQTPEMIAAGTPAAHQYVSRHGPQYESVCECWDAEAAQMICDALNERATA